MGNELTTGWKCVATSGATIDGREIKPEWLNDMAADYDPALYTAMVYIDHQQHTSYGTVRELKSEDVAGEVKLYAKFSPSRQLLTLNQYWEEKLFFSIGFLPNFRGTNKPYLVDLTMTDQPASVGTDETHFSTKLQKDVVRFGQTEGEKFFAEETDAEQPVATKEEVSLLYKFLRLFSQTQKQPQEEDAMNEQQFNEIASKFEELETKMDSVLTQFIAQQPQEQDEVVEADTPKAVAMTTDEFAAEFKKLSEKLEEFATKFEELDAKMAEVPASTQFGENTGAAKSQDLL